MTSAYAADPVFDSNDRPVGFLMARIYNRELALPDFQRNFVWDVRRTMELLRSVMCRFPASTLLFWKQGETSAALAQREIQGAPKLDGKTPAELILDGQQRLTALYRALNDPTEDRYFVKLDKYLHSDGKLREPNEIDFEEAILYVDITKKLKFNPDDRGWQFESIAFPLTEVDEFEKWLDKYARSVTKNVDEQDVLKERLRHVKERYLLPLRSYGFPVVTLPSSTPLEAVCKIFETLNNSGKALGPFELLTAKFYPKKVNLRDLWKEAKDAYKILRDFDVDPYGVLQAITLRSTNPPSAQRSDVLGKLTAEDVNTHWSSVISGFAGVLDTIVNDYGVIAKRWLPYTMMLVPMSAVWQEVQDLSPFDRGLAMERLAHYFWCTVFMTNYDQGANSQAGADYVRLKDWLPFGIGEAPEAVKDFAFSGAELRSAGVRRKALHAGVMALTVCQGAKDFHTGLKLNWIRAQQVPIDSHHIFPKQYLHDNGIFSTELILNRALIDAETNQIISKKAPSIYLGEMRAKYGSGKLRAVLESHVIDSGQGSALEEDKYDAFLDSRCDLVMQLIEQATGKPRSGSVV
jgi:hypothetical protein